jgi:S-adenosylmethionine:tRNA ribosyltransferase-isomerase
MSTIARDRVLEFTVDAEHEAHEPPEARGLARDAVRLLVSAGEDEPVDASFRDLTSFLAPGDLLVVNTSATIPAAFDGWLPDGDPVVLHLSGSLPGGLWLAEVRRPHDGSTIPLRLDRPTDLVLLSGGVAHLLAPFEGSDRLWLATIAVGGDVVSYARAHGRPIRYRHVDRDWPMSAYETIFAREPGSSEMPSASRPFTDAVVTDLVTRGVLLAPVLLHTGVSSLEGAEHPYPEQYRVPRATATTVNAVRETGGRVVAVGTTVVRALATVTDELGVVHPGAGWTEVVVTPETPLPSVDGLVTGWHEPESSHLLMLEAFASARTLQRAYDAALARGYLWHEFGDSHLILRPGAAR